jgi:YHS domain-containing protein
MKIVDQKKVSRHIVSTLLALLLASFMTSVWADKINTGYFGNVAIKGYDPVAYFTRHQAVRGSEQYSLDWLGAEWHFASSEHRALFAASPVKYAPQYGGHCADGIAYGDRTTNIDPKAWRIIEGKLYLNYDQGSAAELEEVPGQLEKVKANWPKVRAQLAAE